MLTTFRMMPRFFFFNEATKTAYALIMMAMSRDTHTLITLRFVCIMKNIFFGKTDLFFCVQL